MADAKLDVTFSSASSAEYEVEQFREKKLNTRLDQIAEEVPVALVYNGVSHAVMMASPTDLADFALGFSISEGIIETQDELYDIEIVPLSNGVELQINIATRCFQHLKEKRRNMTGRTGCGLCGSDSLMHALRLPSATQLLALKQKQKMIVQAQTILISVQSIRAQQRLQLMTGATHASALIGQDGEVLLLREDVGRHNALDKLIGALKKQHLTTGYILTTSRASYEMVQKTVSAGMNMLVAISAPTGLAIRIAKQYGVTLVGFTREQSFVIYNDTQQLIQFDDE